MRLNVEQHSSAIPCRLVNTVQDLYRYEELGKGKQPCLEQEYQTKHTSFESLQRHYNYDVKKELFQDGYSLGY